MILRILYRVTHQEYLKIYGVIFITASENLRQRNQYT